MGPEQGTYDLHGTRHVNAMTGTDEHRLGVARPTPEHGPQDLIPVNDRGTLAGR